MTLRSPDDFLRHGTAAFRRANLALFAAGLATFGLMYSVQPLMPQFSRQFQVSAAAGALPLSLPSAVMAFTMLIAGPLSNAWGRKAIMTVSLWSSTLLVLASAAVPTWHEFLLLRSLLGLTLSGLPAVGMAYLAEEVHPESIGLGMGLYIGGNAVGGLSGRLVAGVLSDYFGWRGGVAGVGLVGVVATWVFTLTLPPSRHFVPQPLRWHETRRHFREVMGDDGLPWLFVAGAVLMGTFVTVYNYVGYRLMAAPYDLSQSAVSTIFGVYVIGVFSSSWIGHLAGRIGRGRLLWCMPLVMLAGLALTLCAAIWLIVSGVAVITFGFFGGHSIISSWVGRRVEGAAAQASAAYLFVYYMGSSVAGAVGGFFYAARGWFGVTAFAAAMLVTALAIAVKLAYLPPPATRPAVARS